MPKLTFNPESHIYLLNGKAVPSVTQIIKPLYNYDAVPLALLQRKGEFGTAVHKAVELHLYGSLDEESLTPELQGCVDAFKGWCADYSKEFDIDSALIERKLLHEKLLYAGTADLVFDGQSVIDIKTRDYYPAVDPLQLVAYEKAHIADGGSKGNYDNYVLSLYPDGTYKFIKAMDRQDWSVFRKLLDRWHSESQFEEFVTKWKATNGSY